MRRNRDIVENAIVGPGAVFDRLRDAIVSGHLKAGSALPTMRELAETEGLTFRAARGIIERLAREGYVKSRPHSGTVVMPKRHTIWRGRVVFVSFERDSASYFVSALSATVRSRLVGEGYLFTPVVAASEDGGDCSQLETMLSQSVDFVIQMYPCRHIERRVSQAGVPHVVIYGNTPSVVNAWSVRFSIDAPIATFVDHCRRAGIRSVAEVRFLGHEFPSAEEGLKAACIRVRQIIIPPLLEWGRYEGIERAAMEWFLGMKRTEYPDLFLIWDDFVAQGALTAFLKRGIRIPEDVRVVVQGNRGLGPVYPDSITRFECDATAVGEKVAGFVLRVLSKGRLPPVPTISPSYVFGKTFPWIQE